MAADPLTAADGSLETALISVMRRFSKTTRYFSPAEPSIQRRVGLILNGSHFGFGFQKGITHTMVIKAVLDNTLINTNTAEC